MSTNSWDIFDTIIGRKCGTPARLWSLLGAQVGINGFAELRRSAEAAVQAGGRDYSIHDIYRQLAKHNGFSNKQADEFCRLELALECEQAFPIAQYARRVKPGDIAVSDMYLSAAQIRTILDAAGIEKDVTIYVTCHGKTQGTVWRDVKSKHSIACHTGDNQRADVATPRRLGIRTELAATGLDAHEQAYARHSESLAWWVRYRRLSDLRSGTAGTLDQLQIQFNMPMLLSWCHELREFVAAKQAAKVLFLARDGCLAKRLWDTLYPEVPSEYLYSSRECLRNGTESYVAYANRRVTSDSVVTDLAASLVSLSFLLPKLAVQPHVFVLFHIPKDGISFPFGNLLNQRQHRINNTYLEMLNYATHWHTADVDRFENPVFDQPDEYDMNLVEAYHGTFDALLADVPSEPFDGLRDVAFYAASRIHERGPFLTKAFPGHFQFEAVRHLSEPLLPIHVSTPNAEVAIIGAADNLRWPRFESWAQSIKLSKFTGPVYMLSYRMDDKSVRRLASHGITRIPCRNDRHVVVDRFRDIAALAETMPDDLWMILLDTTDLVVQTDPAKWLARLPEEYEIVVGSECIRIKDQWWVSRNLRDTFPEHYDAISPHLLYNAGSFAARASTMRMLAKDTWDMCCSKPYTKNNDQDAFNILLHTSKYRHRTKFADQQEGWCANIAATVIEPEHLGKRYATEPLATIDRSGVCHVEDRVVPVFLHHYTRDKKWTSLVASRIKSGRKAQ